MPDDEFEEIKIGFINYIDHLRQRNKAEKAHKPEKHEVERIFEDEPAIQL